MMYMFKETISSLCLPSTMFNIFTLCRFYQPNKTSKLERNSIVTCS